MTNAICKLQKPENCRDYNNEKLCGFVVKNKVCKKKVRKKQDKDLEKRNKKIFEMYKSGISRKEISKKFNLVKNSIYLIIKAQNEKEIPKPTKYTLTKTMSDFCLVNSKQKNPQKMFEEFIEFHTKDNSKIKNMDNEWISWCMEDKFS